MLSFFFLSSGLFLGWSLGANDAANVFGPAVGSRMLKFGTAAAVSSIFIILGAAFSGAETSETLDSLGSVNELAGAFIVALAAAFTVYWMTRLHIPVSTSQAIVGSIIGWNVFSGNLTDISALAKIVSSWVTAPLLSACFSAVLYGIAKAVLSKSSIHILKLDYYNRIGFLIVGAFGAYSLGANNIANVMGVFISVSPFRPFEIGTVSFSSTEQLFMLGSLAIAAGIISYSSETMKTIGRRIARLSPVAALIAVSSSSLVLFVFSSSSLSRLIESAGLPPIPHVPVSSSQAMVGAVIGIGLIKGSRELNYKLLGKIASGWLSTPVAAGLLSFISLFVLQNVFNQEVYKPIYYKVSRESAKVIESAGLDFKGNEELYDSIFRSASEFKDALKDPDNDSIRVLLFLSQIGEVYPDMDRALTDGRLSDVQFSALASVGGMNFQSRWQLYERLAAQTEEWRFEAGKTVRNARLLRLFKTVISEAD